MKSNSQKTSGACRHASQREQVTKIMNDGKERTLQQLADLIHAPTQSIGSRLRELRRPSHGGYTILLRRIGKECPVYLYRMQHKEGNC